MAGRPTATAARLTVDPRGGVVAAAEPGQGAHPRRGRPELGREARPAGSGDPARDHPRRPEMTATGSAAAFELLLADRTRVPLDGGLTIGRAAGNGLRLDDQTVSRRHARITLDGGLL